MSLIKSKQRVTDHGEVFTPSWIVDAMLDLVKGESERIDSRFLEPACGSGNFLTHVLRRKLAAVELKYSQSDFEKRHYALLGIMCIYGIELLPDNIAECRANLLDIFAEYLGLVKTDDFYRAASFVLSLNLVHGDALPSEGRGWWFESTRVRHILLAWHQAQRTDFSNVLYGNKKQGPLKGLVIPATEIRYQKEKL